MPCNCGSKSFLHLSDCSFSNEMAANVYNAISSYLKEGKRVVYGIDRYRSFRPIIDVFKRNFKNDYLIASETHSGGALYLRNGGYLVLVSRDQMDQMRGMNFDVGFIDQGDDLKALKDAITPTILVAGGSINTVDPETHTVNYE